MASPMFPVPENAASKGASDVKWFAGIAMHAMITKLGIPESESSREEIALWAFRMGQAMAKADRELHVSDD